MNLLALAERLGEVMGSATVSFAPDRCLHALDKFSTCTACQNICPVGAIQFEPPPALSSDECQQCRACLPVCPVGAYAADDEAEALLNCARHLGVKSFEVLCALNPNFELGDPQAAAAVRIRGCLAGLGVGAYLGLVNQGFAKIMVRLDACANCPWSSLQSQIEAQISKAQQILAAWNLGETLVCVQPKMSDLIKRPFWQAASPPVSRRGLFRGQDRAKDSEPKREGEDVDKSNPFGERLRLLRAFMKLPAPEFDDFILKDLDFALITVNEECTACGVCSRACPTGALQMALDKDSFQLLFTPQACINCQICSHLCTPNALTISPVFRYDQIFSSSADQILQEGNVTRCAKCNMPFASRVAATLCPACAFRQQNRFGAAIPPGLAANLRMSEIPD